MRTIFPSSLSALTAVSLLAGCTGRPACWPLQRNELMRRYSCSLTMMAVACIAGMALGPTVRGPEDTQATAGAAALTVTVTKPQISRWPVLIPASGRLAAWHEAVIAAEVSGLRIIDVKADVGTAVKKGDLLVQFST